MRKSIWIEVVEWCLLALVGLFTLGVIVLRGEITTSAEASSTAPVVSFDD